MRTVGAAVPDAVGGFTLKPTIPGPNLGNVVFKRDDAARAKEAAAREASETELCDWAIRRRLAGASLIHCPRGGELLLVAPDQVSYAIVRVQVSECVTTTSARS